MTDTMQSRFFLDVLYYNDIVIKQLYYIRKKLYQSTLACSLDSFSLAHEAWVRMARVFTRKEKTIINTAVRLLSRVAFYLPLSFLSRKRSGGQREN